MNQSKPIPQLSPKHCTRTDLTSHRHEPKLSARRLATSFQKLLGTFLLAFAVRLSGNNDGKTWRFLGQLWSLALTGARSWLHAFYREWEKKNNKNIRSARSINSGPSRPHAAPHRIWFRMDGPELITTALTANLLFLSCVFAVLIFDSSSQLFPALLLSFRCTLA